MRFIAFAAFVCAAFAWVPPYIDRAGLAALGLGFIALTIKPPRARQRPSLRNMMADVLADAPPQVAPVTVPTRGGEGTEVFALADGDDGMGDI